MENNTAAPESIVPSKSFGKTFYIVAGILVLLILVLLIFIFTQSNKPTTDTIIENNAATDSEADIISDDSDLEDGMLLIKHIGINLDNYNPSTNMAGDVAFSEQQLGEYDMPYFDYGFQVQATSAGAARRNPQPTFIVPLGTKVHSIVDGVVVGVPKLYSNDYSIQVASSMESKYIYETEHVINPLVAVGDVVKAGDVIAEVSDYDAHNYAGYGLYEIGILVGGNPPSHICPFLYLDDSIKESTYTNLKSLYKAWNEYRGEEVYDESLAVPGCIVTDAIEG